MRVENSCERGTPDLYVAWADLRIQSIETRIQLWIECKTANTPACPELVLTGFEISPDQVQWHVDFQKKTETDSFFLFQVGSGKKARRYLVPSKRLFDYPRITEQVLQTHDWLFRYPVC